MVSGGYSYIKKTDEMSIKTNHRPFYFYGNQPCIIIAQDALIHTFVVVYELEEDK